MAEVSRLVEIVQVVDDDTGMYHMGEIDGLFQDHSLREYLRIYGQRGREELLCHLAYLQHQVIQVHNEMTREENRRQCQTDKT